MNPEATALNSITAVAPEKGMVPIALPTDRKALEAALQSIGPWDTESVRMAWITNTFDLNRIAVSPALAKEAKLYLHREMEALAEVELQKETIDMLKGENTKLRSQLVELQTKMTFDDKDDKDDKDERAAGKADPSKKKKKSASKKNGSTVRITNAEVVADLSELERALEDEAKATKRRSYEIRAEAALLVETVEDRALELVEKAQREVAVLKAELEKVKGGE